MIVENLSPSIAPKHDVLSYLRTDIAVRCCSSAFCVNELRRQEIIEWE
jgi:hypothetical protein